MPKLIAIFISIAGLTTTSILADPLEPPKLGTSDIAVPQFVGESPIPEVLSGAGTTKNLAGQGEAQKMTGIGETVDLVGQGKAEALIGNGKPEPIKISGDTHTSPPPKSAPSPQPITLPGALFAHDSATLTPDAKATIADAAAKIRAAGPGKIHIAGHTSRRGSWLYNKKLSSARAERVKRELIALGIAKHLITTSGQSYDQPIRHGITEADHAANRRVVIHFR